MRELCGRRNAETTLGEIVRLQPCRKRAGIVGNVVHTRTTESRVRGVPDPVYLRGLALSRNLRGSVQGLRWLKIKREASGWPDWVGADETKRQQYIREYHQQEGILFEYEKIEKNPGLRTLAKMMLNSMWGKFGQGPNKTQVREFVDPVQFHKFLDSDKYDMRYKGVINDSRVEVHYQHEVEDDPVLLNLNIFVTCFTTCWARLCLYEALELLGERVLYFVTDSVIYLKRPGLPDPVLGVFLGDSTNEMDGDDYIVEFMSGGPKNYGYTNRDGKV